MPAQLLKRRVEERNGDVSSAEALMRMGQINLTLSYIGRAHRVEAGYLFGPSRGSRHLSHARQTFQYLSHICFGFSYSELAALSRRDRTSVAHACRATEDRRDQQNVDRALHFAELALAECFKHSVGAVDDAS